MGLTSGTKLGSYEILVPLGAGGMGEVYRARDSKLNRDVALKILPARFTDDAERMARFRREAQVLASLNHPNIGSIYGLEESNNLRVLVLELVEGPALADRISEGAIPLEEALEGSGDLCFLVTKRCNFSFRFRRVCFGRRLERKLTGTSGYFSPQCMQLLGQLRVLSNTLFIERLPGLRNRHHQRNRPASERSNYKLHRVYGLQTLHASRRADEANYLVRQVRRISVAQQL
jgi:protein kinase-like protein